jgi:glucokinase
MAVYAGVDLGATKIRAAVGDADGTILGEDRRPTPTNTTGQAVTDTILASLRAACDAAGAAPTELQAVGVGSLGPLDTDRGVVVDPPNVAGVEEIALRDPLSAAIGEGIVRVQNDAIAGVVAERAYGEDTPDNVVYLTISSGIGAGVCVDGRVLQGWRGNAGEVGHLTLDPDGEMTCGCGGAGHWEAYCSGENIPRYARHLHETGEYETDLALDSLTAADVFAARDDELAAAVVDRVARWNTLGVANVVDAFAPEVVAVGGAVALNNPERVLDPVRNRLADHIVGSVPDLRTTTLGAAVVVRGALASVTPG